MISSTTVGDAMALEAVYSFLTFPKRGQPEEPIRPGARLAINNDKLGRMLKNPSYSGITTEFWNSMDAICDRSEWTLWGTPNCGKGQPEQTMGTGHGASPARFRNIKVGSAALDD